jgi:DNA-binding NtrC family response regulator
MGMSLDDGGGTLPGRVSVLVIDDEPDIRELMAFELQDAGYEVLLAERGEAALACLRTRPIDVALLDFRMPGLDGLATLAELLKIDPRLPVIIMSGYFSTEFEADCRSHGAFACAVKPFDLAQIHALLKHARRPNDEGMQSPLG